MTHDEAMNDNPPVMRDEAIAEVTRHNADVSEFLADNGDRAEYNARDVLAWLGY
jgi:hypothetical protein